MPCAAWRGRVSASARFRCTRAPTSGIVRGGVRAFGPLLLALLTAAGPAAAQSGGAPELHVEGCAASLERGLARLIAIELESLPHGRAVRAIHVSCQAESVDVEVTGNLVTKSRSIELAGTAESVRVRVVALTAAELAQELEADQPQPPQSPPQHDQRPGSERARQRRPPRPPFARLQAFVQAAQFDFSGTTSWGLGLRFQYLELDPLLLALDFSASRASSERTLGAVELVTASLGARLGYRLLRGRTSLDAGLGERAGVARISGKSAGQGANAGSVAGVFSAPFAFLATDTLLVGAWRLALQGELGFVALPVQGRVEGDDDVDVQGAWAALDLGVALEF